MATRSGRIEQLDTAASMELLASRPVGRVAFVHHGRPEILPVNHVVDGWSIVFRTTYGPKLVAAASEAPVAFEADEHDPVTRTGWSVVVHGTAEVVLDAAVIERLESLELDTWAEPHERRHWVRIHPDSVTGRRITGP
jgi:uncharacterized protein